MFRVLIIDNNEIVRKDLRQKIDWKRYDFFICGDADNGKDALIKIKELKPDVIFTDIKMPNMNDWSIIKEVRNLNISCKIIILTCSERFEDAKTAIKYGISSYLLKPSDKDEINSTLSVMQKELTKEKREKSIREKNQRLIIEEAIHDILCNTNRKSNVQLIHDINMFEGWKKYKVIILTFDNEMNIMKNKSELKEKLYKYITENEYGYPFVLYGQYGILLNGKWDDENDIYHQSLKNIRKVISHQFNCEIRFTIGQEVYNIDDIRLSYEDACRLEDSRFIYDRQRLIYYQNNIVSSMKINNNKECNVNTVIDYDIIIQKLYFAVVANNTEDIKNALDYIRSEIIVKNFSEEKIKYLYIELYKDVIKLIIENDLIIEKNELEDYDIVSNVFAQHYLEDVNKVIMNRLKEVSEIIFVSDPKYKIKTLVEYVNKNYNKDLTLEGISESFYYSKSYMGKLFRSYTGQKFDLYVDLLRIQKAKELLSSGYKVCEAAKISGFNNIDYFSSKFKKYTGVTPRDYKVNRKEINLKVLDRC